MANVQRGNQRQYFANQISGNEISEAIRHVGNTLSGTFNQTQNVINKANESKLANYQIDLSTKWMAKNNEINTKYQADPTNPQREVELAESFEQLASQYEVNKFCQGQWGQIKNNVFNNYKQYNAKWALQQQETNAQNDLKNGYESLINQVSMLGANGAGVDEVRLIYNNGIEGLKRGGNAVLGEVVTEQFLHTSNHDIMASYVGGLMETDPAKALSLLNDPNSGVANDINNAETVAKLKHAAQQKLLKKTEVDAVDRVADYINSNHDAFSKAFDGTLSIAEAQQILTDKNVDKNMRNVISSMLGYHTKTDMYVDSETGGILSSEKSGSGNGTGSASGGYGMNELTIGNKRWNFVTEKGKNRQPNAQEKEEIRNELFLRGSQLLNNVEGKTPQQAIRKIAEFQTQIAQASYFGLSNGDYNKLMNTFVLPATKDIQAQAQKYNANISNWNPTSGKYGYEQIDKYFDDFAKNLEDTKSNRDLIDKEKALASVYYWSSLNNYCSSKGISMNDLFGLSREERAGIYNKAAKQAIDKAKATTQTPELWFRSMNPQYVAAIRNSLPNSNANDVITNVAVSALSNPNMSEKDFNDIINREVTKEYAKLRTSNKTVVFNGNTKYDEIINQYAMKYKVDPLLVKCVIKQESGFNNNAKSSAGATGLMQLMPKTAAGLGCKNPLDPKQNIEAGTRYLSQLLNQYNGNIPLALAAYNAGAGNVKKYGNKIPPFKETQRYVANITSMYNKARG